jgi:hypothetical protein
LEKQSVEVFFLDVEGFAKIIERRVNVRRLSLDTILGR